MVSHEGPGGECSHNGGIAGYGLAVIKLTTTGYVGDQWQITLGGLRNSHTIWGQINN